MRTAAAPAKARRLADTGAEQGEVVQTSALSLGRARYGLVVKLDLLEGGPDGAVPIEFKRGLVRVPVCDALRSLAPDARDGFGHNCRVPITCSSSGSQ